MKQVLLEKHQGYAIVSLNRPDHMNALSRQLRGDFVDAFAQCAADDSIRVVIVTGIGKAFCAGFDLKELSSGATDNAAQEADNKMARAMEQFDGPIIAAVNGHAITGGFELALACDVLIASESARFADTHARVGILPGWGLSQKLARMIGVSRAKELSLTGRPLFAAEAYEWGLVNHVLTAEDLMPKAVEMAEAMLACVPHIIVQYKKMIDESQNRALKEALVWEEAIAIESAQEAAAEMINMRRKDVVDKGRTERDE
ncbi:MAG: enoyl-CoA hydratase [Pseudomonadales bacterium]